MLNASKLLIDESPLQFQPSLACAIGVNEAIFLQQLHYWLKRSNHFIEGRYWIYKTVKEWNEDTFPFWSNATTKRVITSLRKQKVLIVSRFNKAGFDKTNWYSIDYGSLNQLVSHPLGQNDPTIGSNWHNGLGQNDPTNTNRLHNRLLQENTYNTSGKPDEKVAIKSSQKDLDDRFEELWKLYPRKKGKPVAKKAYKKAIKNGTTDEEIKAGIEALNREIKTNRTAAEYIPHGSTWFNQERWGDEYDTRASSDLGEYSRGDGEGLW